MNTTRRTARVRSAGRLSEELLRGTIKKGDTVLIDEKDGELTVHSEVTQK